MSTNGKINHIFIIMFIIVFVALALLNQVTFTWEAIPQDMVNK